MERLASLGMQAFFVKLISWQEHNAIFVYCFNIGEVIRTVWFLNVWLLLSVMAYGAADKVISLPQPDMSRVANVIASLFFQQELIDCFFVSGFIGRSSQQLRFAFHGDKNKERYACCIK